MYDPKKLTPSTVRSYDIKANQLDDSYYSPCASVFTLQAHLLAYESLPDFRSDIFDELIARTHTDLIAVMEGTDPLGYCRQNDLKEEGVTALLAANITKVFEQYCQCAATDSSATDDVRHRAMILHQSALNVGEKGGDVDIGLYYRFLSDDEYVHKGRRMLFPFLFVEFTKERTRPIEQK